MKEKLKKVFNRKRSVAVALMALMAMVMSVGAFAEGDTGTASIQSAVTTALQTTKTDVLTTIAGVLPYALAIVGAVLVVTIGVKVFKRISGK